MGLFRVEKRRLQRNLIVSVLCLKEPTENMKRDFSQEHVVAAPRE